MSKNNSKYSDRNQTLTNQNEESSRAYPLTPPSTTIGSRQAHSNLFSNDSNTPRTSNSIRDTPVSSSTQSTTMTTTTQRKKNIIIDDSDVIIIQPIKANQLRLLKVDCSDCASKEIISRDLSLYGFILQSLIASIIAFLIFANIYTISRHCNSIYRECNYYRGCSCSLLKCHYTLIIGTILIINFITACLLNYDRYQSTRSGYRLNDKFILFLFWSCGWILGWPIMIFMRFNNSDDRCRISFLRSAALATILSIIWPMTYILFYAF